MVSRKGRSKDYDIHKRKFIFDTYHKHIDNLALIEIARMLGYEHSVSLCNMRNSRWWAELEDQRAKE